MSIWWGIRLTLIGLIFILIIIFGKFLKNREKYSSILENPAINLILVVFFNAFCYTAMLLPSDEALIQKPPFFSLILNTMCYDILGLILMIFGILILIRTILMRKALGAQDTSGKLLTNGIYSFSRHPIYLGIIIVSLGLGLRTINIDALLIYPLIILANFTQSKLEEIYDVGVRFKQKYSEYKNKTRLFGPIWFWLLILSVLILPLLLSIIILSL